MNRRTIHDWRAGLSLRGNVARDVPVFLAHYGHAKTARHCAAVAAEAARIARLTQSDPAKAEIAGWLHDVSAVIPDAERAALARESGVEVLAEEAAFPMILHQQLSVVLGREIFGISDEEILSAVGCHTTLKRDASVLDKVVFVADKVAWDQEGAPPYLADLLAALDRSIDHAALVYLRYLWERRASLRVVHPWMVAAYEQISGLV